jgi:hypothetical protein
MNPTNTRQIETVQRRDGAAAPGERKQWQTKLRSASASRATRLLLESQDTSDQMDVGTDCALVGLEMLENEVRRLRAEVVALKAKGN